MKFYITEAGIGITICDWLNSEGSHWIWLCKLLNVDYLHIGFQWKDFNWLENFYTWYDGHHSALWFLGFYISWGGPNPFKKEK